jgi:hypothetical protein
VGATADLVAPLANMLLAALKDAHDHVEQDPSDASGTDGDHPKHAVPASCRHGIPDRDRANRPGIPGWTLHWDPHDNPAEASLRC